MTKSTKPPKSSSRYTLGRAGFSKIGEVEGIKPSRKLEEAFQDFDRRGLNASERRRELVRKYGSKY